MSAMVGRIRCVFLTLTDQVEISLRRFIWAENVTCAATRTGIHDASVMIGRDAKANVSDVHGDHWPHSDPRWPKACACGYEFKDGDEWQFNPDKLWKRSDNGEVLTLDDAPVGAMWFAPWYADHPAYTGPDGQCLVVRLPGNHDWIVDSRASNCDMKDKPHKCWIRHGSPPDVTVDKNGFTCTAGAGSIAIPQWHGFLRAGYLEPC